MKSVYAKYELPGVPELGDSSKTKLHLLFVQGVVGGIKDLRNLGGINANSPVTYMH